jgi:uncharacterized membrane protein
MEVGLMVGKTRQRMSPAARWSVAALITAVPLVVVAATYGWWQGRLPDPLPTHWNHRGQVDGTTGSAGIAVTMLVIAGSGALLGAVGALLVSLRWRTRRILLNTLIDQQRR